ncbi:hypothetical protein [Saccharothrix australiensis]|uniref:Uncharacterized protein n=1 Tax=Saccharothrix australiensis TaxID=2072 RepID=A0A495W192_9PSEU|nr:hypothetical protein [Saccharothrix australiensis]RKT54890.1 hypothetical protein C8E97_3541 [Saccharothrix australiensis]
MTRFATLLPGAIGGTATRAAGPTPSTSPRRPGRVVEHDYGPRARPAAGSADV